MIIKMSYLCEVCLCEKRKTRVLPWLRNTLQWQLGWRYTSPGHEADH